jgi:hypothetical protein
VIGPALAGLLIAGFGTGAAMAVNAGSYPALVIGLRTRRPSELRLVARDGGVRVADGLRHPASRPDLVMPLALVLFIGLFRLNFQLTLPLPAKTVFHADAMSFGLLTTAFAAGSLLTALAVTARRGARPLVR